MTVAEYLAQHPERTYAWLSRKTGVSAATASKVGRGRHVGARTRHRIEFYLEQTFDWPGAETPQPPAPQAED